jgi:hypothetical protein
MFCQQGPSLFELSKNGIKFAVMEKKFLLVEFSGFLIRTRQIQSENRKRDPDRLSFFM